MAKQLITFRLEAKAIDLIKAIADNEGMTQAAVVEAAIDAYTQEIIAKNFFYQDEYDKLIQSIRLASEVAAAFENGMHFKRRGLSRRLVEIIQEVSTESAIEQPAKKRTRKSDDNKNHPVPPASPEQS